MSDYLEILKEYITFDRVIMVATLIVTICTFIYTLNKDKRQTKSLLKRKQAQLTAMEESMRYGVEVSAAAHLRVEMAALRAEIEELKMQL